MNTSKLNYFKMDVEKTVIMLGMAFMEASGAILLFCGLFDIKIF